NRNTDEEIPLGLRTCNPTVCPRAISLPTFFPIRLVEGLSASFLDLRSTPSITIRAPASNPRPVIIRFFPTTAALSICGTLEFVTITLKAQDTPAPPESRAVQATVVVPTGKFPPEGGEQVTVNPAQLSSAVGAA